MRTSGGMFVMVTIDRGLPNGKKELKMVLVEFRTIILCGHNIGDPNFDDETAI